MAPLVTRVDVRSLMLLNPPAVELRKLRIILWALQPTPETPCYPRNPLTRLVSQALLVIGVNEARVTKRAPVQDRVAPLLGVITMA